jgi:hypothetical protein
MNRKEYITVTIYKNHPSFKMKIERITTGGILSEYVYTDTMKKLLGL